MMDGPQVADLLHDLDDGMRPISVFFPYLPTPYHKKRDEGEGRLCTYQQQQQQQHLLLSARQLLHVASVSCCMCGAPAEPGAQPPSQRLGVSALPLN